MRKQTLGVMLVLLGLLVFAGCAHNQGACCGNAAKEDVQQKAEAPKTPDAATPTPPEKDCKTANERGECAMTPEELKELKDAATAPKAP